MFQNQGRSGGGCTCGSLGKVGFQGNMWITHCQPEKLPNPILDPAVSRRCKRVKGIAKHVQSGWVKDDYSLFLLSLVFPNDSDQENFLLQPEVKITEPVTLWEIFSGGFLNCHPAPQDRSPGSSWPSPWGQQGKDPGGQNEWISYIENTMRSTKKEKRKKKKQRKLRKKFKNKNVNKWK